MNEEDNHKNLMSYLRQADATFRNGFEDDKLKQIFLRNTLEEISGSEVQFCMQKAFSFILEGMIKEAELGAVLNFYVQLKKDWIKLANDQSGCHVLQAICQRIVLCINDSGVLSTEVIDKLHELPTIVDFDSELISSIMKDCYSTHAFRAHVQLLAGLWLKDLKSKAREIKLAKEKIPKNFIEKLKSICLLIQELSEKQYVEFLTDAHAAPCITCILEVLSKRKLLKTLHLLCGKVLLCCDAKILLILFKDMHASHVFESIFQHGDSDSKSSMEKVLRSDKRTFFDLCAHPTANFVIQRFISCINDEEHFNDVFQFIAEGLEDVLAGQNYGILQRICDQCLRFPKCQKIFLDKVLEAFHCKTAEDRASVVMLFATLRTRDSYLLNPEVGRVEYHGSVLLQSMLKFENVGLIVKSMCETSARNILMLSCDNKGSHFIDTYFASEKVKVKKKKELIEKIGAAASKLGCDKYGSRVLENMWDASDIAMKRLLAHFLVEDYDIMSENDFGKYILKKFQIKRFQTRQKEWELIQKQHSKRRRLFEGIASGTKHRRTK